MFIGKESQLTDIATMEIIRPERAGDRWKGIKHIDLIEGIKQQLEYRQIDTLGQKFSVSEDGMSLIGYFLIDPNIDGLAGQNYMLGFRHSNDLRFPITLSIGSLITICHNGIITGEYIMRKKHTLNLDLEQELFSAIRDTTVQYAGVKQDIDHMRVTDLFGDYERLLVAGARKNVYPWSWIGKIDKEYSAPSEDNPECKDYLGTRWGLYNAFNYVMRDATPQRQAESLYRFMGIMN